MSIKQYILEQGMEVTHQMAANSSKDKKLYIKAELYGTSDNHTVEYVVLRHGKIVLQTRDAILAAETYDNI